MTLNLTAKEQQLLAVFISHMPSELPKVDWEKIAPLIGHKYGRNARAAFTKVWEKLKGDDVGGDDDSSNSLLVKTPVKSTPKKGVGARKSPIKADGAASAKKPRRTKAQVAAANTALNMGKDENMKDEKIQYGFKQEQAEQDAEYAEALDHGQVESDQHEIDMQMDKDALANGRAYVPPFFSDAMDEDEEA